MGIINLYYYIQKTLSFMKVIYKGEIKRVPDM